MSADGGQGRRGGFGGMPPSFGRVQPDEVVEKPEPGVVGPVQIPGGLRLVDGRLVVDVDALLVVPDAALQDLYDQIRDVVALAVADGFAAATGRPAKDVGDILPGAVAEPGGSGSG